MRAGGGEWAKIGFYGLDLYSLDRSVHEIITYLDRVDPAAADRARERYACFDHFSGDDAQVYGFQALSHAARVPNRPRLLVGLVLARSHLQTG